MSNSTVEFLSAGVSACAAPTTDPPYNTPYNTRLFISFLLRFLILLDVYLLDMCLFDVRVLCVNGHLLAVRVQTCAV